MKWFKKFSQPDWRTMAQAELEVAKLSLLRAETALDWAQSNVDYNVSRIERLERTLKNDMQQTMQSGAKLQGM